MNVSIEFCALVISVISLVISIVFSQLQVQHNKDSLRPVSWIRVKDFEDEIAVLIQNVGMGPMTIRRLRFENDEGVFSSLISMVVGLDVSWSTFVWTADGWTLPVSEELYLLQWTPNGRVLASPTRRLTGGLGEREAREQIRRELAKTTVLLDYSDIFGRTFHDERELNFFSRLLEDNTDSPPDARK